MADDADKRSEYTVEIGGVEHTVLLDEDHAKRMGAAKSEGADTKARQPANKSRTSSDK